MQNPGGVCPSAPGYPGRVRVLAFWCTRVPGPGPGAGFLVHPGTRAGPGAGFLVHPARFFRVHPGAHPARFLPLASTYRPHFALSVARSRSNRSAHAGARCCSRSPQRAPPRGKRGAPRRPGLVRTTALRCGSRPCRSASLRAAPMRRQKLTVVDTGSAPASPPPLPPLPASLQAIQAEAAVRKEMPKITSARGSPAVRSSPPSAT